MKFDGSISARQAIAALVLAVCVWGCVPALDMTGASAQENSVAPRQGPPATSPLTIEFNLPSDFSTRAPDGTFVWRALQIGYFGARGDLIRASEIPRDAIRVSGRTGQVSIPTLPMPAGANRVSIRLRGLSSGRPGEWSESINVTMPALERGRRTRTAAAARTRRLTPEDIARRPALKQALNPLLGSNLALDEVLDSFSRVQELALAVVLSRTHGIQFSMLCRIVRGPPRTSVAAAARKLQPPLDGRTLNTARAEARKHLAVSSNTK
jgi:hypothetical protein